MLPRSCPWTTFLGTCILACGLTIERSIYRLERLSSMISVWRLSWTLVSTRFWSKPWSSPTAGPCKSVALFATKIATYTCANYHGGADAALARSPVLRSRNKMHQIAWSVVYLGSKRMKPFWWALALAKDRFVKTLLVMQISICSLQRLKWLEVRTTSKWTRAGPLFRVCRLNTLSRRLVTKWSLMMFHSLASETRYLFSLARMDLVKLQFFRV